MSRFEVIQFDHGWPWDVYTHAGFDDAQRMVDWCKRSFDDDSTWSWRWEDSRFSFTRKEDAIMFVLAWGYDDVNA
jgi:hypothetical protein